jgi:hypothetical protein
MTGTLERKIEVRNMNIFYYAECVHFQFFRKVDELDFFLDAALTNALNFKRTPPPKSIQFASVMEYTFSSFLNAAISAWEIVKLSNQLTNSINGKSINDNIPTEKKLESDYQVFCNYFGIENQEIHKLFVFLKSARNASAHDGTISVNGGTYDEFLFMTDIHRYIINSNTFEEKTFETPNGNVIKCMYDIALLLIPLFHSKLQIINIPEGLDYEIAEFIYEINKDPEYKTFLASMKEQYIKSIINSRKSRPNTESIKDKVKKWEEIRKKI